MNSIRALLKDIPRFGLVFIPLILLLSGLSIDRDSEEIRPANTQLVSQSNESTAKTAKLKARPNGTVWQSGIVLTEDQALLIEFKEPVSIARLHLQADHNDQYLVEASTDGKRFSEIWQVKQVIPSGLQTRKSPYLKFRQEFVALKISALNGDNFYSVSDISVFQAASPIPLGAVMLAFGWIVWILLLGLSRFSPNGAASKLIAALKTPLLDAACGFYIAGVLVRFAHIFFIHPADEYIYSDMLVYAHGALNILNPEYKFTIWDTVMPQGMSYFLAFFYSLADNWNFAFTAQFVLSCLVPIFLWDIGRRIYSNQAGLVALLISSIHFPYIEYPAFFLSEGPIIFALVFWFWCLIRAFQARTKTQALIYSFLSGISLGGAITLKGIALAAGVFAYLPFLLRPRGERSRLQLGAAVLIGACLVVLPLSFRMTEAAEGRFTVVSRNAALNVLLGHHGYIAGAQFKDQSGRGSQSWGPTAHVQRGYTEVIEVDAAPFESGKLLKQAWEWSSSNPLDAALLSVNHVYDLFFAQHWPSIATKSRRWADLSQMFFALFILVPAFMRIFVLIRKGYSKIPTPELSLILLTGCVMLVSFFTIGSPRIRAPFDAFFILLAARQYTSKTLLGNETEKSYRRI